MHYLRCLQIEAYIKGISVYGVWVVVGILIVLTIANHLITVYSPYKNYERWAKNRWFFLDKESKSIIEKYGAMGIDLRVNIMVPRRSFLNFLEPLTILKKEFRKPVFFGEIFDVVWSNENMGVDRQLKFTTNQGVCGKAFTSADKVYGANFLDESTGTFNLNKNQLELTKNLVFLASFRIIDETKSPDRGPNKVIGVLNIESETKGSQTLITDEGKQKPFYKDIIAFATLCNKLM